MPAAPFRVEFAVEAIADLYEIEDYWSERGESWRGEKYFRELAELALRQLSDPDEARRGRLVTSPGYRGAREVLVFGIYRVIYDVDEQRSQVNVLRFWHAHRDEPRRDT